MLLIQMYSSEDLTEDDIQLVIDSISDSNNYLSFNVRPVERILTLLQDNFDVSAFCFIGHHTQSLKCCTLLTQPKAPEGPFSLELHMKPRSFTSSFSSFYGHSCRSEEHTSELQSIMPH